MLRSIRCHGLHRTRGIQLLLGSFTAQSTTSQNTTEQEHIWDEESAGWYHNNCSNACKHGILAVGQLGEGR